MNREKLSLAEKMGYGMGDAGCNMVGGAVKTRDRHVVKPMPRITPSCSSSL
ncbi:hypothetical protein EDC52_104128 [Biostraticola tofi]|uniref:Uncharacterized protein n=1 Tax=Biostraticola tofi TaxID=466109 RepID=A0A4R3YXU6_9GAMM|nr:hypothetical protein EDC52_104128 [Biostraticola tofi]